MVNKQFFLTVFLIYAALSSFAQKNIKGYVFDDTGDPIKFAHIQDLNDPLNNTSSNENGEFEVGLQEGQYVFKVTALNYQSAEFDVTVNDDLSELEFVLMHVVNAQEEIIIYSGEDPGVKKMREVIKRRKQHADYLQSLVTDVYLKGNLKVLEFPRRFMGQEMTDSMLAEMGLDSNRQGIIYLLEQHTKYYYERPGKTFNEVQSVRASGDPQDLGFAQMPPIINIYENNVSILTGLSPRGIISPAHSNAFHYYDFKLTESFYDDDKMISKIKVTPKRKFEPLFTGYVYVVENDWIFHSFELTIDRSRGIDLLDSVTLVQSFSNYENDKWIIKNQIIEPKLKIFGITIGGNFLTHYTHQSINKAIDPAIFNSKLISVYDSTALDRDSSYWSSNRKIPLTELEEKNFIKGDSLFKEMSIEDSVKTSQAQYSFRPMTLLLSGIRIKKADNTFITNGIIEMIQFNNVEGLNLTLRPQYSTSLGKATVLNAGAHIRYGFASKQFYSKLEGTVHKTLNNNRENYYKLTVGGGRYISDITGLEPIPELYNTITALSGRNYLRFYEKDYFRTQWEHSLGNGFLYKVSAGYEDRRPLENNTEYTWFKSSNEHIVQNNPQELPAFSPHRAFNIKLQMEYQPGWKYIQYPKELEVVKSRAPSFRITYEKGIKNLFNSDVDFDKLSAGVSAAIYMKLFGRLDINAETGGFINKNKVGNPDLFHNRGNEIWLASQYLNSFQLAGYYELSHDRFYGKAQTEWHLNGLLSNKIPLFKNLNWHFVLANNTLYHNKDHYYTEISFGIENLGFNIYRFGRLDFVYGYHAALKSSSYGLRFGFSGLLGSSTHIE